MKYCITGAGGHVSSLLTRQLLQSGHSVKLVGRNKKHLEQFENAGATLAIGSVEDEDFLQAAFEGVDAVYTMCPPAVNNKNGLVSYSEAIGKNYKRAIELNQIKYVVNLSSVGAHLREGAGHIGGMNKVENALNELTETNILHLRPVFFYTNLFAQMDLIRNLGILGSIFSMGEGRFPMADPSDIAQIAFDELTALAFKGHSFRYIASDERSTDDIAEVIGKAIGKTDLRWVQFSNEQFFEGLVQSGFSEQTAEEFVQGFTAMHEGRITEDYWKHRPPLGKVKLEEFAKRFDLVYSAQKTATAPH